MFSTPPKNRATSEGPPKGRETSTALSARAPPAGAGFVRRRSGELESLHAAARTTPPAAPAPCLLNETVVKARPPAPAVPLASLNKKVLFAESQRMVEAREKIRETKKKMDENLNMKRDVKAAIHECLDKLLKLLKDSEEGNETGMKVTEKDKMVERIEISDERRKEEKNMIAIIEGHSKLLQESKKEMSELKETIAKHAELTPGSYASVAAGPPRAKPAGGTAVHSIVVSSRNDADTGDEVLERVRVAVNAREEGIKIEKVRKGRDGKVIIGCGTRDEMGRVRARLEKTGKNLNIEEMENKDPLIILRDVLKCNTDEQVLQGIRKQNGHLFLNLPKEEDRMMVKFRKRARNTLTEHIVIRASPKIWSRLTEAGAVYVDLQRVRVQDQSPLMQCSRCLGYGHGKRFCREPVDACSHCGGPHLRAACTALAEGSLPRCVNCVGAQLERVDHNAFSEDCPVRRRWDKLARSTVQYC